MRIRRFSKMCPLQIGFAPECIKDHPAGWPFLCYCPLLQNPIYRSVYFGNARRGGACPLRKSLLFELLDKLEFTFSRTGRNGSLCRRFLPSEPACRTGRSHRSSFPLCPGGLLPRTYLPCRRGPERRSDRQAPDQSR